MAGYVIHLACAKEYLKHHPNINPIDFINGTISPDLTNDKSKTYYGIDSRRTNLSEYLKYNNINNDFDLGFFYHLIVDYYFYSEYLKNIDWNNIGNKLYQDYDSLDNILINKYRIDVPEIIKHMTKGEKNKLNILSEITIINFISKMSMIDINEIELASKQKRKTKQLF